MSIFTEPTFPMLFKGTPEDLVRFDRELLMTLGLWSQMLKGILNKGISLKDNIDATVASFVSNATPDTEDAVPHDLGKVPLHFIVSSLDKAAIVYCGSTPFTDTHVYMKTSAASAAVQLILL